MNKLKALINHFKLSTTMNTLFDEWLDSKRHLKAQSIRTYTQLLEGYLRPAFGEMVVREIRKNLLIICRKNIVLKPFMRFTVALKRFLT